ncbi:Bgt-50551 [Blumeria graminis f. sp. tritici]|uniref:Bgt-50551 n=1 Tax=Blumeria graminis f. sp. tritici TaxID=62690 RepID=A0A9X9MIU5_BLUGR|nr:Bgt-50551 [Blumeria graminis f. sp. tritici]
MVTKRPWLSAMQDNAPTHTAAITMEDMSQRLIQPIFWRPTRLILTRLKLFGIR